MFSLFTSRLRGTKSTIDWLFDEVKNSCEKGIELLGKKLDCKTIALWNQYIYTTTHLVDNATNSNFQKKYMELLVQHRNKSLYNYLKIQVEFLLEVLKYLKSLQKYNKGKEE